VLSLKTPASQVETSFASQHKCGLWATVALTNLH
jgi:hypothetical protein